MSQNTEQLYTGVAYSYIEYLNAYLELVSNSLFFSTQYLDEETYEMQNELKEIFLALPDVLSESNQKEKCAQQLLALRPKLELKYRALNAYRRELLHLVSVWQNNGLIANYSLEEAGLTDEEISAYDFTSLADDCTKFVFNQTDEHTKQLRASALFPAIPIKITKDNFLLYVRKSLQHITIDDHPQAAEALTTILKEQYDGRLFNDYGDHFPDLLEALEALYDLTDPIDCSEEADSFEQTLNTLFDMISKMYRMICTLSNLLLFDKLSFKEITQMNATFLDAYYCVKKVIEKEDDYELVLETLPEQIHNTCIDLQKSYKKINKTKNTDPSFIVIDTYLNMNINTQFGFTMSPTSHHYSLEVEQIFDAFVDSLRDKLTSAPTADRKLRMQYFMGTIPFVMKESTFTAYIRQAFTNFAYPKRIFMAALSLQAILDEHHFYPETHDPNLDMVPYRFDPEIDDFDLPESDLGTSPDKSYSFSIESLYSQTEE